ncbi:MAG: hypothetical protein HC896_08620 [Bacteroidales bacterium]|nr:hypothetical protein [Bacteroidales bacterium]
MLAGEIEKVLGITYYNILRDNLLASRDQFRMSTAIEASDKIIRQITNK